MKTIKFRAWEIKEPKLNFAGRMHYLGITEDFFTYVARNPQDYILMQFTGLTDKNGKEIYEGDLVTDINNKIRKVRWVDNGWNLLGKYKVIGNIYENPELLK